MAAVGGYQRVRSSSPVNPVTDDCAISESASFLRGQRAYRVSAGQLSEVRGDLLLRDDGFRSGRLARVFYEIFLPQGYPDSVSSDYLWYQLWDTLQAFASSLSGALATRAVLLGAGVGDDKASVLGATISWLLKDGFGHVGRITFAWWKGYDLDCNSKQWRLFADVANDIASIMYMLSGAFPWLYTPILCAGSVMRALVGVAGAATRVAVTQHQALRDNLADVSAKDGSQETLVNLSALIVSLVMLPAITEAWEVIVALALFTAVHLYANWKAVTSLEFNVFNSWRLQIVVDNYFKTGLIMGVDEANRLEPVLPTPGILLGRSLNPRVTLGCSVEGALKMAKNRYQFMKVFQAKKYFITAPVKRAGGKHSVKVLLREGVAPIDLIEAYYASLAATFVASGFKRDDVWRDSPGFMLLASSVIAGIRNDLNYQDFITPDMVGHSTGEFAKIRAECGGSPTPFVMKFVEGTFRDFIEAAEEAGWVTDKAFLGASERRCTWSSSKSD